MRVHKKAESFLSANDQKTIIKDFGEIMFLPFVTREVFDDEGLPSFCNFRSSEELFSKFLETRKKTWIKNAKITRVTLRIEIFYVISIKYLRITFSRRNSYKLTLPNTKIVRPSRKTKHESTYMTATFYMFAYYINLT